MSKPEASPRFSVIVSSRGRPSLLMRTLTAIRQLDYPAFEIVVVGDSEALAAARCGPVAELKLVSFNEANIASARNLGIAHAAGEVCAFIDDDAVPEALWLRHHAEGLLRTGAVASVGYVRGPDGIGFQSRYETIGRDAVSQAMPAEGDKPFLPRQRGERPVKLVGTNMAIRRDVLLRLGGFYPSYRYFLEDGDLSLRLAEGGYPVAVAPLAEVHHALAASPQRRRKRTMRTLFDIGRSTAIFLRRHWGSDPQDAFPGFAGREGRRLLDAMVRGTLEPRDIRRLMGTLTKGWNEGMRASLPDPVALIPALAEFHPIAPFPSGHEVFACRLVRRGGTLAAARRAVQSGSGRASVFCLALTGLPHSVRYTDDGLWVQTGGQFVPHRVTGRRFRWCRFADLVEDEMHRVANCRGLTESDVASGNGSP